MGREALARIKVVVFRDPEGGRWWVAKAVVCGEAVVDQGGSLEEAVENLREATLRDVHRGIVSKHLQDGFRYA